jgi:glycine/D-amino acid oxidase-like deaminating enzyme
MSILKTNYDFAIIGNGILGSTLAWKLSEELPNSKIILIGPKDRFGSASIASGAMINVFAEL